MMRSRVSCLSDSGSKLALRRGAAALWLVVALPVLLTLFCVILEVANLYTARAEFQNALEAAAQAAVKNWADSGGGDTQNARTVGNTFAQANTINGVSVNFLPNLNYNNTNLCNQNASRDGVFVFGAITMDNPEFVFDCCATPGCGVANVVMDATGQGQLGSNNSFGISFQPSQALVPDLRILRVVYRLPEQCEARVGAGNNFQTVAPRFNLNTLPVVSDVVADGDPNAILRDNCPNGQGGLSAQADVHGINRNSVSFRYDVLETDPCGSGTLINGTINVQTRSLAIVFPNDPNNNDDLERFDIMDRIRFGAVVTDTLSNGQLDADAIGGCMTEVTICFSDNTSCTGQFFDNTHRSNQCAQCVTLASWGNNDQPPSNVPPSENRGLIIHPNGVPDLPCPPGASANNNGQALASVVAGSCSGGGGSGQAFAVRAQGTYSVPSICSSLFGLPVGPFQVTAKADALYDCALQRPRLYHLEERNFICP